MPTLLFANITTLHCVYTMHLVPSLRKQDIDNGFNRPFKILDIKYRLIVDTTIYNTIFEEISSLGGGTQTFRLGL